MYNIISACIAGTTMRKKAYSSSPSRVQLLGCRQFEGSLGSKSRLSPL
jgi:hypothetical protein